MRARLDNIVEKKLLVLVGDANGADRAVQQYLKGKGHDRVVVFCTNGECRNNLGGWPVHNVPFAHKRRDFAFYSAKDRCMTEEATVGFMIWDGESRGTEANIVRLLEAGKKVVVYSQLLKGIATLHALPDWEALKAKAQKAVDAGADSDSVVQAEARTSIF